MYLNASSLKGVSSMKLHRDLGITQKSAWYMAHRLREGMASIQMTFAGPIEVDEAYFGGKERNKHANKRSRLGRGPSGKTAVVGAKDRATNQVQAEVIASVDKDTLSNFVDKYAHESATVYTDGSTAYKGRKNHECVRQQYWRVRAWASPHQRRGELLGRIKMRVLRHLSSHAPQTPAPLRLGVCRPTQLP